MNSLPIQTNNETRVSFNVAYDPFTPLVRNSTPNNNNNNNPHNNNSETTIDFPIDLVYTWVNDTDEKWQESMQRRMIETQYSNQLVDSVASCRWRDLEELRYSIESVCVFAPWIRNIFVITADQTPSWLVETQFPVTIVSHREIFQRFEEHLPTFNSHAIECHLHKIPGLAEHFIYANDDTFFGAPCQPEDFFTPSGQFKVFLSPIDLPTTNPSKMENPNAYVMAQFNTYSALINTYGKTYIPKPPKRLIHQMKPLRRSVYEYCWNHPELMLYLFNTSSNPFRHVTDIDPTNLISQVGLLHQSAVPGKIHSKYYPITDHQPVEPIFRHLKKFKPTPKLFCINDDMKSPTPQKMKKIRIGFQKYLPHRYLSRNTNTNTNKPQ